MGKCLSKASPPESAPQLQEEPHVEMPRINRQNSQHHVELDEKEISMLEEQIQIDAQQGLKLQHIFESVYDAATKAHNNVQLNNLHHFFWMMPLNEHNVHVPRSIKIEIPTEDGYKTMSVPIITLMNHKTVCMSEIKLKTELAMELTSFQKNTNGCYSIIQKDYSLKLTPGKKTTSLEMTIKLDEPLEMYNRILSKLEQNM